MVTGEVEHYALRLLAASQASFGTDQALTLADDLNQNLGAVLGPAIAKDGPITVTSIATSDQIVEVKVLACSFCVFPRLGLQCRAGCIMRMHACCRRRISGSQWEECAPDSPEKTWAVYCPTIVQLRGAARCGSSKPMLRRQ